MINICYSYPQGVILYRYSGRVDGIGSGGGGAASVSLRASTRMLRLCRMVFEGKLRPVFLKGFHIFILTVRGAALLPDFGRQPQR